MLQQLETPSDHSQHENDLDQLTFGIVDAVAAIVENFWLLTLVPLLVAAIAIAASSNFPKSYTSTAYISLSDENARRAESLIKTPDVLKRALLDARPSLAATTNLQKEIKGLRESISLVPSNNQPRKLANVFELRISDTDPELARATNQALIHHWLEGTRPSPARKKRIERLIGLLTTNIPRQVGVEGPVAVPVPPNSQARDAAPADSRSTGVQSSIPESASSGPTIIIADSADRDSERMQREKDVFELEEQLLGTTRDVVISEPTTGVSNQHPPHLIASIAAASTGLLLLMFVLLRKMVEMSDPITKAKWHRVAEQLPWRRGRYTATSQTQNRT